MAYIWNKNGIQNGPKYGMEMAYQDGKPPFEVAAFKLKCRRFSRTVFSSRRGFQKNEGFIELCIIYYVYIYSCILFTFT